MSDVNDPLASAALLALAAQSRELLAASDDRGTIVWANPRFVAATGLRANGSATLMQCAPPGPRGDPTRRALFAAITGAAFDAAALPFRSADGAALWVELQVGHHAGQLLWTFTDVTATRSLARQARRLGEWLDTAQEFGRLGLWERSIPSGEGHWDRHMFGFWGLDPALGTPSHAEALLRIHPDERSLTTYPESTRLAGRYAERYRIVQPDGKTRWVHSQWDVKNGPNGDPDRAIGVLMDAAEADAAPRTLGDVNAQLKLAVDLGHIAIWRHDLRTQRMHYSDLAYKILNMPPRPEGLSIEEVRALIHPDDIAQVLASAEEALASDRPTDMEARYRRTDGSWRYIMTRRVVERDAAGTALAFVGVALDVTERVEQLRRAEELARRLEAASQAAGIGLWTSTSDPPGGEWNTQMFALFDRFAAPHVPLFAEWLGACVHPDDRARVGRQACAYLTVGDAPYEMEFRILRRDGSTRWVVMRADRDRAATGTRRFLGIAMDSTEQHAALEALRDASERASLITRHAGIGTWEARMDGSPERWDEQMFHLRGMAPQERAPSREERLAIVHPDDVPNVLDSSMDAPAAGQAAAYEFRVRLPDGRYRWLASRSAAVVDASGRAMRRVGVNWDVTEAKEAERVRQQAALAEREVQAKSQFLSRMSHELRTPLNAVLGFTQLLQIEARQSAQAGQLAKLEHIRAAGGHLLSLINDVLDLSGLESGELKLALQAVDLGALIRQSVPLVDSLAAQHGVIVEVGTAQGTASADPTRLRQVLINLLSNAIKYNRRGGRVLIQARGSGSERVALTVRDTGRGLSPAQIACLFEPFNRFGAENENIEGTGIGLTIVKALVSGMGGTIEVASTPGAGTAFEVVLPAHTATSAVPSGSREPPEPAHAEPGRSGQILYIEDNHVNVLLVEELVKTVQGLSLTSEPTGAAGVAKARSLRPDLVLIDLQLPDFDGFEVLRQLRADPVTREIPCIALSANAMPEDIQRGLDAGFVDYWTKPIDFSAFLSALGKLFPATPPSARKSPESALLR